MGFKVDFGRIDFSEWYRGWVYVAPEVGPAADLVKVGCSQVIESRIVLLWAWGSPWSLRGSHRRTFYAGSVRNMWTGEAKALEAMAPHRAFVSRPWSGRASGWTEMFRCDPQEAAGVVSEAIGVAMTPLFFDPVTNKVTGSGVS